jgi:hypothetical protein
VPLSTAELRVNDAATAVEDDRERQRAKLVAQALRQLDRAEARRSATDSSANLLREFAHFVDLIDGDADKLSLWPSLA